MSEVLADLNKTFRPDICIIDGLVGMEGPGPSGGLRKEAGVIICGRDFFSCDVVAARIMGFNPKSVPSLRFAAQRGLGSFDGLEVVGGIIPFERFAFIPTYVYHGYRIAFLLGRLAIRSRKLLESLSEFLSQFSTGLYIVVKGYRMITGYGTVLRDDVISYGRSLFLRVIVRVRLRLHGIT
jgi:hypothetical protein